MFTLQAQAAYPGGIPEPRAGMRIQGDHWSGQQCELIDGDGLDRMYFGTGLRYETGKSAVPSLPVKIEITGRVIFCENNGARRVRARFTGWWDEDRPEIWGGWLWLTRG